MTNLLSQTNYFRDNTYLNKINLLVWFDIEKMKEKKTMFLEYINVNAWFY